MEWQNTYMDVMGVLRHAFVGILEGSCLFQCLITVDLMLLVSAVWCRYWLTLAVRIAPPQLPAAWSADC